jgi:hypothetical protein
MRRASPDGAFPGLHSKPLDVTIRRVHAPYANAEAMVIDGGETQNTKN